MKIYPMPKIVGRDGKYYCMCFYFEISDNGNNQLCVYAWDNYNDEEWIVYSIKEIALNQTFEQAVISWVETWVKENFEGVEVPTDSRISMGSEYPEVPEPWLVNDPWVECPLDPKRVRMPCEAQLWDITDDGYIGILKDIRSKAQLPFISDAAFVHSRVRQSSIIPVAEEERLWWIKDTTGNIFKPTQFGTSKNVLSRYGIADYIQPYNAESQFGPIESKWVKV